MNIFDASPHEALDGVHCALRSLDQIFARRIANYDLIPFIKGDDGGHKIQPVLAGDHDRALPLHERHQRIGGSKIDADDALSGH